MKYALLLCLLPLSVTAAIVATLAPATWDLYTGTTKTKTVATQQACIDAAKALGIVKSYTCRTRTGVAISVTVDPPSTAIVSWTPPTQNTDGSALINLAGYRFYYGTSMQALNHVVVVPIVDTFVVACLAPGTWYITVTARNAAGIESDRSNIATKVL